MNAIFFSAHSAARSITRGGLRPPAAAAALKSPPEKPLVAEPAHAMNEYKYVDPHQIRLGRLMQAQGTDRQYAPRGAGAAYAHTKQRRVDTQQYVQCKWPLQCMHCGELPAAHLSEPCMLASRPKIQPHKHSQVNCQRTVPGHSMRGSCKPHLLARRRS